MNQLAGRDVFQGNQNYSMANLLSDNSEQQIQEQYVDSIFKFITSASNLVNSTLSSLNETKASNSFIDPSKKSFYYVRQNGVFELMLQSQSKADIFFKYYLDINSQQYSINLSIFIIRSLTIIIFFFIIVYAGAQVQKGNVFVVSLFSYIPIHELKKISRVCDAFIQRFDQQNNIEDSFLKQNEKQQEQTKQLDNLHILLGQTNIRSKEVSLIQESNLNLLHGNSKLQTSAFNTPMHLAARESPNMTFNTQLMPSISTRRNEDYNLNEMIELNQKMQDIDKNDLQNISNKVKKKQDKNGQEEVQELEINRLSKFLNQKTEKSKFLVFKQILITVFLIMYFFCSYYLDVLFQTYSENSFTHYRQSMLRPFNLKQMRLMTIEVLLFGEIISKDRTNLIYYYVEASYNDEKDILSSFYWSYPPQLDDYRFQYLKKDSYNFCAYMNITDDEVANCELVFNGVNKRGLRSGIVSYIETTRDIFLSFKDTDKSFEVINGILSDNFYNSIEDSLKYIKICSAENSVLLKSSYQNYLDVQTTYMITIFIGCILILFFSVILCVKPFLDSLNNRIWKTKGMLSLIPTQIVYQYPQLKQAFLQSNIFFKKQ